LGRNADAHDVCAGFRVNGGDLTACSDRAVELTNNWGCGPIDGLKQVTSAKAPKYILVGEFIETSEASAAFAELSCQLAARQDAKGGPLFVGVSEYVGGATDAEQKMRARLDALVAKGVPIVVGVIGGNDHPYSVHQRSAAEKEWARNIEDKVVTSGASRAVLLMSRTDAIDKPIEPVGERFSGYQPMATFLPEGEVLALEIGARPQAGVTAPAIRLYPSMTDGFHGQIALASLTRPEVEVVKYEPAAKPDRAINISDPRIERVLSSMMSRDQKIDALEAVLDTYEQASDSTGPQAMARKEKLRRMAASIIDMWKRRPKSVILPKSEPGPAPN
jgi:hypothetical protein